MFKRGENVSQVWQLKKAVMDRKASCPSCKNGFPKGKPYICVNALFVPPNQPFAISRVFYFCAYPSCISKKPAYSNVIIPPNKIEAGSIIKASEITEFRKRKLNIV